MKPWRQIARPHRDVLEGTFTQAQFAVDISQVANGTAMPSYQDPVSFFSRTYITEGMEQLLISVVQRLAGNGGDPVIQLQTNFGGGKTHTLLAVYHLVRHTCPTEKMRGIPSLLDKAGVTTLPQARIAIIDGIHLSVNQPAERGDLKIRTVWGQIAYQLLGADGYAMVRESDEAGTAPGKEVMVALLKKAAPCVILMDELVAFYRQLDGVDRLTAGTLESNMSFIQSLTESVKIVPDAILLASLPESDTEVVGSFGQTVLTTLEKYFGRVESVWKPVASDESFEIVRRRLFDSVGDSEEMETVCREFANYYRKNKEKFPPEVQESVYADRMRRSYPIHPEIFDRLYQDWSTLDKFQKTRGVLQYMAVIINRLWNSNDQDPLIMPGSIPLEDVTVRTKSTKYLSPGWDPIIESEIDGESSEPARIDGDTRFGSIQAAHRAARTIFLGSAPASSSQVKQGVSVDRILLGCAIPGQTLAIYEDVLRRLRDKLHYLFTDNDRYRFDTRPNLRREMESRKGRVEELQLNNSLRRSAVSEIGQSPLFAGVHVFTPSGDIPDDIGNGPRLVVLPPDLNCAYAASNKKAAFDTASAILEKRGEQPRMHRNRLFFLAADLTNQVRMIDQCKIYLAWEDIVKDIDAGRMNLDAFQMQTARLSKDSAEKVLRNMVRECYRYLLIPIPDGASKVTFKVERLPTDPSRKSIAENVARVLLNGEEIIERWSPMFLKQVLEKSYFTNGQTEVSTKKIWQDFCSYYQMPRLLNQGVLEKTIADGVTKGDFFGFADGKDGEKYFGFKYAEQFFAPSVDDQSLLIECEAAAKYKADHAVKLPVSESTEASKGAGSDIGKSVGTWPETSPGNTAVERGSGSDTQTRKKYRRYFGSVSLDSFSGAGQAQQIFAELVSLFTMKPGVNVKIRLDIEATSETPFDDNTVRAVRENGNALKFDSDSNFEEDI